MALLSLFSFMPFDNRQNLKSFSPPRQKVYQNPEKLFQLLQKKLFEKTFISFSFLGRAWPQS